MSSANKCCVPGCNNARSSGYTLHKFPNPVKDPERFSTWLYRVGADLLHLNNSFIYKYRVVCNEHFKPQYKNKFNRSLRYDAVPTLKLAGFYGGLTSSGGPLQDITNNPQPSTSNQDYVNIINVEPSSSKDTKTQTERSHERHSLTKKTVDKSLKGHISMPAPPTKETSSLLHQIKKLQTAKDNIKLKLKKALKLSENRTFQSAISKFTSAAVIFIMMQLRESKKLKMGRRFTKDEKVLCLSLYKQGPRAYRWLQKIFVLPSPITLSRMISTANLKPGINENIFEALRKRVNKMKSNHEKACVLLFDEVSLTPHFDYNSRKDHIIGFTKNAHQIADHALVFMIRGLYKNFKQPIAYSFCAGSTHKSELMVQIKTIIKKLQSVGIVVAATVCDQGSSNLSAINGLIEETRQDYRRNDREFKGQGFEVEGQEVVPIFDPPHLLKGIRNNLLTKDLKCTLINNKSLTAKWSHVMEFYEKNPTYKGLKLVPRLSERHVMPKKMAKMKVKCAAQVFSRSLGVQMGYLAEQGVLKEEMRETADVLLFFDELFDSVNGSYHGSKKKPGKDLLLPLTAGSKHWAVWSKAKEVLGSMKYVTSEGKYAKVPSINNWIISLNNIEYLFKINSEKFNFKSMWLRHLNQDPLENFFGCVRSHGYRNTSPSCSGFEVAFSSLLINNLNSVHKDSFNCEQDSCSVFTSMKSLFFSKSALKTQDEKSSIEIDSDHVLNDNMIVDVEEKLKNLQLKGTIEYVAGHAFRKLKFKVFKECAECNANFLIKDGVSEAIKIREYDKNRPKLTYVAQSALKYFSNMQDIITCVLKNKSHIKDLKTYIKTVVSIHLDYNFISCNQHKNLNINALENCVINLFLYSWTKNTNNILEGRSSIPEDGDFAQKLARNYYLKRNKHKK